MLGTGILLDVKHLAVLHLQAPPAWKTFSREVPSQKGAIDSLVPLSEFANVIHRVHLLSPFIALPSAQFWVAANGLKSIQKRLQEGVGISGDK